MNIEHLVEPKLKDLEKQIEKVRYLNDIHYNVEMLEYNLAESNGIGSHRIGNMVIQRDSGAYLVSFQIQKL